MSLKGSCLLTGLLIAGLCAGSYAHSPGDLFTINFSREVVVGDKILPAGLWDIRWDDSSKHPMLKIYRNDALNATVAAVSISSDSNRKRTVTEGVIEKMGPEYYLTTIWIKGQEKGYRIELPSYATALPRGDTQRVSATFVSGSRYIQAATTQGQSRTHVATGLGNPDDRSQTGIVLARNYYPGATPSEAVAELEPAGQFPNGALVETFPPDSPSLIAEVPLSDPGAEQPFSVGDDQVSSPEPLQIVTEAPEEIQQTVRAEPVETLPALDAFDAAAAPEAQPAAENQFPANDAFQEEPSQQVSAETALAQEDTAALQSDSPQWSEDLSDFGQALPATASNWLEFGLIGLALVGLSFAVRWG